MWSKYLRRPLNKLEDLCFAQFAKMYTSARQGKEKEENTCDEDEEETENNKEDKSDDKFNYIMTYKDEPLNGTKLPNYIKLTDPYPG